MLNMEPNKGLNQTWDHDLSQNQESDAKVTAIAPLITYFKYVQFVYIS